MTAFPYELPAGPERTRRPRCPRRIGPGERYLPDAMVPLDAAMDGDTQLLVARFPGRTGEPLVDLDRLAQRPEIDSLIVSTEIRLSRPVRSLHELLLTSVTPVPTAATLANLPELRTLHAPQAMTTRTLAIDALAAGLAQLATHRGCLADVDEISRLGGLENLELTLYPGDSVASIGKLARLVSLRIGGSKIGGWKALASCELLEEALLIGLTGANLRPFGRWTKLKKLTITRRGLRSLAGIEQFGALEELDLRMLSIEDLGPLAALPRLRVLRLRGLTAAHDLTPLAEVSTLERLEVSRAGIEEADIVHVDSIRPLSSLTRLTEVVLSGTAIDDGDLAPLSELPRLRRLVIAENPSPVLAELTAQRKVEVVVIPGPSTAAAITHGLPIRPASDRTWYLRADLTQRLGAETNYDAEELVRKAITGKDSALGRRLSFDTEASAVVISAADPADLRAVAAIIESAAGR
jgi:hypothetical protein